MTLKQLWFLKFCSTLLNFEALSIICSHNFLRAGFLSWQRCAALFYWHLVFTICCICWHKHFFISLAFHTKASSPLFGVTWQKQKDTRSAHQITDASLSKDLVHMPCSIEKDFCLTTSVGFRKSSAQTATTLEINHLLFLGHSYQ